MGITSTTASRAPSVSTMLRQWRLKDFAEGEGSAARAFDATSSDDGWIAVEAPGDVYLALHAAGRISDPFGDRAEKACAWVKDREWWWRTDFDALQAAHDQRLILEFQGLDTYATIWLNGEIIGRSENMFRAVRFDITGRARQGKNRLAVSFRPTASAVVDQRCRRGRSLPTRSERPSATSSARRSSVGAGIGVRLCRQWASGNRFCSERKRRRRCEL